MKVILLGSILISLLWSCSKQHATIKEKEKAQPKKIISATVLFSNIQYDRVKPSELKTLIADLDENFDYPTFWRSLNQNSRANKVEPWFQYLVSLANKEGEKFKFYPQCTKFLDDPKYNEITNSLNLYLSKLYTNLLKKPSSQQQKKELAYVLDIIYTLADRCYNKGLSKEYHNKAHKVAFKTFEKLNEGAETREEIKNSVFLKLYKQYLILIQTTFDQKLDLGSPPFDSVDVWDFLLAIGSSEENSIFYREMGFNVLAAINNFDAQESSLINRVSLFDADDIETNDEYFKELIKNPDTKSKRILTAAIFENENLNETNKKSLFITFQNEIKDILKEGGNQILKQELIKLLYTKDPENENNQRIKLNTLKEDLTSEDSIPSENLVNTILDVNLRINKYDPNTRNEHLNAYFNPATPIYITEFINKPEIKEEIFGTISNNELEIPLNNYLANTNFDGISSDNGLVFIANLIDNNNLGRNHLSPLLNRWDQFELKYANGAEESQKYQHRLDFFRVYLGLINQINDAVWLTRTRSIDDYDPQTILTNEDLYLQTNQSLNHIKAKILEITDRNDDQKLILNKIDNILYNPTGELD